MKQIFFTILFAFWALALVGQEKAPEEFGWKRGGAFGFDLSGLGIRNPRIGAGLNRFGIGGMGTYFMNRKEEKSFWDNGIGLQLGVVRVGGPESDFQKAIDLLRLQSEYGRSFTANNKWYVTGLVIGTTGLLTTYADNLLNSNGGRRDLFSQFFSPAQLQFHPGVRYKPNEHFSVLISPLGFKYLYVGDKNLAARNIHGNEFGKQSRAEAVFAIAPQFTQKFFNDRVAFTSSLNWTTDYLNNAFKHGALNFWQNNLSFMITKNLSLDLFGEAQNDHNKFVQRDVNNDGLINIGKVLPITADGQLPKTDGPDRLGRGTQLVGSFLLKYNKIF